MVNLNQDWILIEQRLKENHLQLETMAKKKKKTDEKVVANCDHPEKGGVSLSQHDIEKLIITVRGEQVLLDQDIARLYGVTTKRLNE